MEVLTSLDMKCGKCIVFVTVVAALAASATAFDGYKLDDMGNPISLNAEAPRAKPSLQGQGMERFREAAAPAIKADPHIAKLVKEKTEIAIKLAAFEPTPEAPAKKGISAEELEQLNASGKKWKLQHSPEGAKLLEDGKRLSQNPHENVDSFLNLLFSLRRSLATAKSDSKNVWKKSKAPAKNRSKSPTKD